MPEPQLVNKNDDDVVSIFKIFVYTQTKTLLHTKQEYGYYKTPQIGGKFNVQLLITRIIHLLTLDETAINK